MATYLQGVTDYIPQFQPFQPDLNFYGNIMQTKQTQYDNNWKALNNIYSKYYYADMSREKNVKTRDAFIKDAEFNLKKISQLDLSLEQNVNQATQIFKPFYENKNLMKDMAWTQNKNSTLSTAESYKNSLDPKMHERYWDDGVLEVQYLTEEFKNATDEEALNFANVDYTANVDVSKRAFDIAKEFGDIETAKFTDDKRWLIKTRNGQQLEEPLQKLFEARLGNDPGVQSYFKTKAYVQRKNYGKSNAAQFDNDESKAEMQYLQDKFSILKTKNEVAYKQLQETNVAYDSRIKDIQAQIDKGNKDPKLKASIDEYRMNKDINDQVLKRVEKDKDLMATNQGGANATNPYGDLKSFRYKVDNGMASLLMEKQLGEAAHTYAFRNYKEDPHVNPYQVNAEKHGQNMALLNARLQGDRKLAEYKAGLIAKRDDEKAKIDAGTHLKNEKGEVVPKFNMANFMTEIIGQGTSVDGEKVNVRALAEQTQRKYTEINAVPYFTTMFQVLQNGVNAKSGSQITQKQLNYIINGNENKNVDLRKWATQIQTNPNSFLTDKVGTKWMQGINNRFKNFIQTNSELTTVKGAQLELSKTSTKFDDYLLYIDESKKFEKSLTTNIEKELTKQGIKYAKYLYDENGNIRGENAFNKSINKGAKIAYADQGGSNVAFYDDSGQMYSLPLNKAKQQGYNVKYLKKGQKITDFRPEVYDYLNATNNDYQKLVSAASKIVTNQSNMRQITGGKAVPGLEKFSDGTGLFAKMQSLTVNPRSSFGMLHYGQVIGDIFQQDLGANNVTITTGGFGVSGAKDGKISDAAGRAFLTELQREIDKGEKGFGFKMGVSPIALGQSNKSAYNFQLSAELIKKLTGKVSDKGVLTGGIFTPDQGQFALTNGVSFIMDSKAFKSDMYNSIYQDPLAVYVANNKSYDWTDPMNSNYNIKIENALPGMGDFRMSGTYPIFNTETNEYEEVSFAQTLYNAKQNLSEQRDITAFDLFSKVRDINNQRTNGN